MANLQNYNGRFCESEYENAFLSFLEEEGWQYLAGNSIVRDSKRDVLYADDLEQFLSKTNPGPLTRCARSWTTSVWLVQRATLPRCIRSMAGW